MEAEAVTTQAAPGVLVKAEGVGGAAQAGLEVAEQNVDPAELGQIVGILPSRHAGLVTTARADDGAKGGQAIGEHCEARCQVLNST